MFYYSKIGRAKVIHTAECPCCRRTAGKNLRSVSSPGEFLMNGFRLCCRCFRTGRRFRGEAVKIRAFAAENGLRLGLEGQDLTVTTAAGSWKLRLDSKTNALHLYHRSVRRNKAAEAPEVPGYHDQKIVGGSFLRHLHYIAGHDLFRLDHPAQKTAKVTPPDNRDARVFRKRQQEARRDRYCRDTLRDFLAYGDLSGSYVCAV